jgi:hypothetical protein
LNYIYIVVYLRRRVINWRSAEVSWGRIILFCKHRSSIIILRIIRNLTVGVSEVVSRLRLSSIISWRIETWLNLRWRITHWISHEKFWRSII